MNLKQLFRIAFALSAATGLVHAQPQPVSFDWFEYSGHDTVKSETGPKEYHNPILAGFYPDPSICRVGDDYYLINSSFAYFPGIPIFHSRDLVNWEQVGNVIDRPDQLHYDRLGVSAGIFAPSIRYHNGTYYVVCTMVGTIGNFVVTATNAAGPWSDPVALGFEGIDPSLFFDDDGHAWMINNGAPEGRPLYNGHRAIWLQEFDPVAKKMVGPRKVLVNGGTDLSKKPIWIEGPHLYKRAGRYYLCCAEGGTGPEHSEVVFGSGSVDGPYAPWDGNPFLTQRDLDPNAPGSVTCTGHADMVIGPDNQWWAVFLGVRPYDGKFSPMGRETFMLPVTWTADGWPVILPKGERVPLAIKTPNNAAISLSDAIPVSGDITRHVEFKGRALTPQWVMLRAPKETWWKLNPEAGQIAITPRSELLSGTGNPSYLALRVQHSHFKASTSVEVPTESGVSAGLAVFQNDRHHYFLAVSREGDGMVVYLERAAGDRGQMAASARLPRASRMKLRVTADDAKCASEYAADAGDWKTLAADADATQLTTEVAGGFVGATVGMHARVDGPAVVERITSTNSFAAATTYRFKAGATAAFIDTKGQV